MIELTGYSFHGSDVRMPEPPEWVCKESNIIKMKRGTRFIRPLDPVNFIYVVISGIITILAADENGHENMVVSVPAGGIVGEMEALAGISGMVYSARALEDSELLKIPLNTFLTWLRSDAPACMAISRVLAGKLCSASLQSVRNTKLNAFQRVVWQFLQHGPGKVEMTHQELAELCSVSLRTVNRCIKQLKDGQFINIVGGKVELLDEKNAQMKDKFLFADNLES